MICNIEFIIINEYTLLSVNEHIDLQLNMYNDVYIVNTKQLKHYTVGHKTVPMFACYAVFP